MTNRLTRYVAAQKRIQRKLPKSWAHVGDETGIGATVQSDGSVFIRESILDPETPDEVGIVIPYESVESLYLWLKFLVEDKEK